MVKYRISHFIWFSNNNLTLGRKWRISSSKTAIATVPSQQPLCSGRLWRWIFYPNGCYRGIRQIELAEWPLAGTWPSAFWWQFSYSCCAQGPKPEYQNYCHGWALDRCHLCGNRSVLFGIASHPEHLPQLCLSSWAKGHRHPVIG